MLQMKPVGRVKNLSVESEWARTGWSWAGTGPNQSEGPDQTRMGQSRPRPENRLDQEQIGLEQIGPEPDGPEQELGQTRRNSLDQN